MRKIRETKYYSWRIGKLPGGCKLCVRGAKLVLLVTGLCGSRCWYCPLSERKKNKDVIVANEWWIWQSPEDSDMCQSISRDKDVIEEAKLCDSLGAGITGGDPLVVIDRTIRYIRMLKREFGNDFHIHLYTSGKLASDKNLKRLDDAGLDEIRFHPAKKDWNKVKTALKFSWDVGCEIPVIPWEKSRIIEFIDFIEDIGVNFLNLNELEISETNFVEMQKRGFRQKGDISYAVKGSEELSMELLDYCAKNTSLNVHYCTVKLKDSVQLGNRLKKRARNARGGFDIMTDEGLLVRGAIYLPELYPSFDYSTKIMRISVDEKNKILSKLNIITKEIKENFSIPQELIEVDERRLRILIAPWILEEISAEIKKQGLKPAIVEEYPTWDALCIDLRFL